MISSKQDLFKCFQFRCNSIGNKYITDMKIIFSLISIIVMLSEFTNNLSSFSFSGRYTPGQSYKAATRSLHCSRSETAESNGVLSNSYIAEKEPLERPIFVVWIIQKAAEQVAYVAILQLN